MRLPKSPSLHASLVSQAVLPKLDAARQDPAGSRSQFSYWKHHKSSFYWQRAKLVQRCCTAEPSSTILKFIWILLPMAPNLVCLGTAASKCEEQTKHQKHPASAVPCFFPKFSANNLIFSSSPRLCFHFIHLPKPAFHPMSFFTTLLKIEAVSPSPTYLTNPGPYLFLLHTNQVWQAEVSLGTHTGFQKRNWRQEMLLHKLQPHNCPQRSPYLGAVVKAESPDAKSCCCITARAWKGKAPKHHHFLEMFLNPEDT